jgi:prephenate dehydratase
MKIGLSGNIGSFSEEATDYYCQKENIKDYQKEYLISAEKALASVEDGTVDLGIFPIENSNGGIVYEAVYAMAKHLFEIQKMFEIDIRHNLIVKPGTKKEDIKVIASHPQALKQCRMYIKQHWPDAELKEWSDTASAVKAVKESELPEGSAAIASSKAAEIHKMEILEDGIQDLKFNFTTFLAITKK